MWLLFLEAGMAFALFIFFVWWTMFSGRDKEDNMDEEDKKDEDKN